jgi:uncharacterized protein (DUF488 family)
MAADLLTIGYGGKRPGDFYSELEALRPDIIVDVRENPYHAFLGAYTKKRLEMRLGSRYIWIRELGNASRVLPPPLVDEVEGLERLRVLMQQHKRVVLLCAEKEEERCHRSYIKARLQKEKAPT